MLSLPAKVPSPEHEIIFCMKAGNPHAEIMDIKTLVRGVIHKALCPTDKELLGVPVDPTATLGWDHISKLILGHFYGPEIAAAYHQELLEERLVPLLDEDGGWLSSHDVYEWLQKKNLNAELDSGPSPR